MIEEGERMSLEKMRPLAALDERGSWLHHNNGFSPRISRGGDGVTTTIRKHAHQDSSSIGHRADEPHLAATL